MVSSLSKPRRFEEWRYRLFGPTLVHLQYELYLLCSLMLLTVGSMSGLYKESFGTYPGDYIFLLLMFLALSRHLFFRLLCTWDPSTHASPGVAGLLTHLLQSHVTGGQSFDRPAPLMQLQLHHAGNSSGSEYNYRTSGGGSHAGVSASSSTSAIASPAAADRMIQITGGVLETKEISSWSQLVPCSLVYALQLPRQYLWFPLSRMGARPSSRRPNSNDDESGIRYARNADPPRLGWFRRTFKAIQQNTLHLWISYCPSLQFLLASVVFVIYARQFCFYTTGKTPLALIQGADNVRHTSIFSVHTHDSKVVREAAEKDAAKMTGTYELQLKPPGTEVFMVMVGFGTLLSLFLFSRVMLPLPDLVAGGNVVKGVRTETRAAALAHQTSATVGGSGVGSKKGRTGSGWLSRVHHARDYLLSLMALPSSVHASDAAVWSERQSSIAAESRLHVALGVVFVRVLENIFLVGFVPRSNFICRATGHCSAGPPLWELSRILYPGGFSKPKRQDGFQVYGFMESDKPSALWTMIGLVVVSMVLLLAQTVVLNRSYLSILAYHTLEWELVDKKHQQPMATPSSPASTPQPHSSTATVWEPKRKYLKGERVYYPDASGSMYYATSNSPEGHPYDREFRGMNERFRSELGHTATSELLGELASYQLVAAILHFVLWVVLLLVGYSAKTYGLSWAVTAHVMATHGALSVASASAPIGLSKKSRSQPSGAMRALQQLNAEIVEGN